MFKASIFASCLVMLIGCAHQPRSDLEYRGDAWVEAESHVRGRDNIPAEGIMFLYSGPWGWSDPDRRITVDFRDGYRTTLQRYHSHPGPQGMDLFDAGVRSRAELFAGLRFDEWVTSPSACAGLRDAVEEIWTLVTNRAADFDYDPSDPGLFMLDGGFSYDFWLSNGHLRKVLFSVENEEDSLVETVGELEEMIIDCAS